MNRYEALFASEQAIEDITLLQTGIDAASTWEDAYWTGKCFFSKTNSSYDRQTIDAFERAFYLGLNVKSAPTLFFDASQIIARLYFQYGDYELASNKLMILVENRTDVPSWVHLFYASAQIHTDNLLYIAEDPTFFFARLDQINIDDEKEVIRRNSVYREFLNLLINIYNDGVITSVSETRIFEKAIVYQLNAAAELIKFREVFLPNALIPAVENHNMPAIFDVIDHTDKQEELQRQFELLEKERAELALLTEEQRRQIIELEGKVLSTDVLFQENKRIRRELEEKSKLLAQLQEKIDTLTDSIYKTVKGHDLLRRNQKLLVMGGTEVKEHILRGVAKSNSKFENEDIEFVLDYDKIKLYTSRIKPWSSIYMGIIVGPCPHKTIDSGDYSSFIQKIKEENGYPHVEEARESNGQLKLSKQSFKQALDRMVVHIQSIS